MSYVEYHRERSLEVASTQKTLKTLRQWVVCSLPNDQLSIENGIIIDRARRFLGGNWQISRPFMAIHGLYTLQDQ